MSEFVKLGTFPFWEKHASQVYDLDSKIITPVLQRAKIPFGEKWKNEMNGYVIRLAFRQSLYLAFDIIESSALVSLFTDQGKRKLLGEFTPIWSIEESQDRFMAFLLAYKKGR